MGFRAKLKERGVSLPMLSLVVVLAASGASLYWGMSTLKVLSAERDALSSDLSRLTVLQTTIARGESVLDDLEGSVSAIKGNVPETMEFQTFYSELTLLTHKHDIEVSKIEPKEAEQSPEYRWMAITLTAESSFRDFFQFTQDLGAAQRLVTLERMDVRGLVDGERCSFEITLNIYSMDEGGETNG